jgi:O-antigen/teichoic acid export membrane protein
MLPETKTILRGSISYLASGILSGITPFIVSLLVSRALGKEGLGFLSVVFTLVLMGVLLSELGLNPVILRDFADPKRVRALPLRAILTFRFAAALFVAALVAALMMLAGVPSLLIPGTSALIIMRSTAGVLENYLKARLLHRIYLGVTFLRAVLQIAVVYVLLHNGSGLGTVLLGLAIVDLLTTLVFGAFSVHELRSAAANLFSHQTDLRSLFAQSLPFMLIGLLTFINERADILLLAAMRGAEEVGLYSAADRFLIVVNLIDSALLATTLPTLTTLLRTKRYGSVMKQLFVIVGGISLVGTAVLFFAAPVLIGVTFRFTESVRLLQVLALAIPAILANRLLRSVLYSLKRERAISVLLALTSVGGVVMNILFIPLYGAMAAALVTVGGEYLLAGLYYRLYVAETHRAP